MTQHILQAAAAAFIVCGGIMAVLVMLAKPGWESEETGFHHGEPPQHTDFDGDNL